MSIMTTLLVVRGMNNSKMQGSAEHRGLQQHLSASSSEQYQTSGGHGSLGYDHHPPVMQLPPPLLYTCTVGRARSGAR